MIGRDVCASFKRRHELRTDSDGRSKGLPNRAVGDAAWLAGEASLLFQAEDTMLLRSCRTRR